MCKSFAGNFLGITYSYGKAEVFRHCQLKLEAINYDTLADKFMYLPNDDTQN